LDNRIDKQIGNLVDALMGPIIVFSGGWGDSLPDWIKGAIQIERLAQLMKGEETATDTEACAYLYTASLTNPIDRDWVQVYLHVASKVVSRNKDTQIPEDIKVDSLDDYQMGLLRDLKQWIWDRRAKVRQERRRLGKAQAKVEAEARAPKQLGLPV